MTWPSMKNAMDASYALSRSLTLLISHVHSDLQCNFTVSSTLGNGQNFFGSYSSSQITCVEAEEVEFSRFRFRFHRFRFHIPARIS